MSYCRFSSSNWGCDVYVYECVTGNFVVHVAQNRKSVPPIPQLPLRLIGRYPRLWRLLNRLHYWSLDAIPMRRIELPHAGETFECDTASSCASLLRSLKSIGYRVPDYAIAALYEEAAAEGEAE